MGKGCITNYNRLANREVKDHYKTLDYMYQWGNFIKT